MCDAWHVLDGAERYAVVVYRIEVCVVNRKLSRQLKRAGFRRKVCPGLPIGKEPEVTQAF